MDASTNILFWPGSPVESVRFTVTDTPVRIIGVVPEEAIVTVWRNYDNLGVTCEFDVPPIPVMCCDTCGQLSLWTEPYADCPTGQLVQSEVVIASSGVYFLKYEASHENTPPTVVGDVFVWMRDEKIMEGGCQ